jgi:ubiquinone/menaquinone biosynthesis C-methylase UbiE
MDLQVKNFYNKNYKRFDISRVRIWGSVRKFTSFMKPNSKVIDIGCGNGKNIKYLQDNGMEVKGIDFSSKLVEICQEKNLDVIEADMRNLPYQDNTFDYGICIAALHHLQEEKDRIKALNEMIRVCKDGAEILVTVWSVEQDSTSNEKHRNFIYGDNYVPWENVTRYYFIYDKLHIEDFLKKFDVKELKWERGNWYFIIKVKKTNLKN